MLDSIDVANLPDGAGAYAGYTTGRFPTWDALKTRFKGKAHLVSIAIAATEHALCLDIETGDAQPWEAPAWVQAEHARSVARPILYASASKMLTVMAYLHSHNIARTAVRLWSAHYGAGSHICGPTTCKLTPAMDGTQWTDTAAGANGAKVDESLLADGFFTTPAVKPAELDGQVVWYAGGTLHNRGVLSGDSGKTWA